MRRSFSTKISQIYPLFKKIQVKVNNLGKVRKWKNSFHIFQWKFNINVTDFYDTRRNLFQKDEYIFSAYAKGIVFLHTPRTNQYILRYKIPLPIEFRNWSIFLQFTNKYPLSLLFHGFSSRSKSWEATKTRHCFRVTKITIFGKDNSFIRRVISNDLPRERGFVNLDSSIKRGGWNVFSRWCRASFRQIYLGPVDDLRTQGSADEIRKEISSRRREERKYRRGRSSYNASKILCPSRMKISQRTERNPLTLFSLPNNFSESLCNH